MEKEEKVEEKEEQESKSEQEEAQPERKKIPVNLIITAIVVICLLGGGFFVWKSGLLSGVFKKTNAVEMEGGTTGKGLGPIYTMETFIVNLLGDRGNNYLKARIELELDNDKLKSEIDKRLPQFRDSILTMLSNKTHEDIKTLEGKFQLRAEIMTALNQHLKTGKVVNVYFTDFIIQ